MYQEPPIITHSYSFTSGYVLPYDIKLHGTLCLHEPKLQGPIQLHDDKLPSVLHCAKLHSIT